MARVARVDVERGSLERDAIGYATDRRAALVMDLIAPSTQVRKLALDTVDASGNSMAIGDPHPEFPELACIRQSVEMAGSSAAWVISDYARPTWENSPQLVSQEIAIDVTPIRERTLEDINGVRMSSQLQIQGGPLVTTFPWAERTRNLLTVRILRIENITEDQAFVRARDFVSKVNDAPWFGYPARSWKLDDLIHRTAYGALRQRMEYILVANLIGPKYWQFSSEVVWGGQVPDYASIGNGIDYWDILELADFTAGLPVTLPVA